MKAGLDPHTRVLSTRPPSLVWAAVETVIVTGLALYLSLRFDLDIIWLLLPLALSAIRGDSLSDLGLEFRFRPPSFRFHLGFGAMLLALYAFGHYGLSRLVFHQTFDLRLPPRPALDLLREFLSVAIPEELFFRGYLQGRWNRVLRRPWRFLGADLGAGLLVQAGVFALCHLVTGDWRRLSVFFFALLAGWLRERSGSIFPPAAYHAVANVWYQTLVASFH